MQCIIIIVILNLPVSLQFVVVSCVVLFSLYLVMNARQPSVMILT